MTKIRVAVLRGGPSPAYEESLKTGSYIISLLKDSPHYEPVDVFISREGQWHVHGLVEEPNTILSRADVTWNALHGAYGESGEVQRLLHSLGHLFTGSGVTASIFSHNKDLTKEFYKKQGLPTPMHATISLEGFDEAELVKVFRAFLHPVIVKPTTGVRGVGVKMARTFHDMVDAVKSSFSHSPKVMIEEYIRGTVATCSVLENAKGEPLYALLPIHLDTYHRRVRPTPEQNRWMEDMAKTAHQALGLRHYSSSDFIITPRGKIYILETNSNPLFHEDSMLHSSLLASGWKPYDFVDHCLKQVLEK